MNNGIELRLFIGRYGEEVKSINLPISEGLLRDLMEPMELSDDPFSLMMASGGMSGGIGNAVIVRKKVFRMRLQTAEEVGRLVKEALLDNFGANDRTDGYAKSELAG